MPVRFLTVSLLCLTTNNVNAQIKLTSGQYTTQNGYYMVKTDVSDKELTLIEPNRNSVYQKLEGNVFQFVHPESKIDHY